MIIIFKRVFFLIYSFKGILHDTLLIKYNIIIPSNVPKINEIHVSVLLNSLILANPAPKNKKCDKKYINKLLFFFHIIFPPYILILFYLYKNLYLILYLNLTNNLYSLFLFFYNIFPLIPKYLNHFLVFFL